MTLINPVRKHYRLDAAEMTVDGLWFLSIPQEMVYIRIGFLDGRLLYGNLQPAAEVTEDVDIVFYSVSRTVPSL